MINDVDVCVVGSGAGAGPVVLELSKAGYSVLVLEKGPWFTEEDFYKDELACCRRSVYTPQLADEQHVIEEQNRAGEWFGEPTSKSGWDFWNGNCVGGSSNLMSGYFYRLKPCDFRLLSTYGEIEGANIVDWPIGYEDLEPYYSKAEIEVGISGRVAKHPFAEPRSTADFPYPPTAEHPISSWFDNSCHALGLNPLPVSRAILSKPEGKRRSCEYSGYCGSFGCASGAKGSSRAALLDRAIETGNCEIRPHAKVSRLLSDSTGKVVAAEYFDKHDEKKRVEAKLFVVACQAIETVRLLAYSSGPKHPNGLGNRYGQLGKNLVFSAGGSGIGDFVYASLDPPLVEQLKIQGPFVNRGLQDWYEIDAPAFGGKAKGGTVDFLFRHPNPITRANRLKWDDDDELRWGQPLKQQLKSHFTESRYLRFEVFCDWLPTDNCFVSLDSQVKDKWGTPVARIRVGYHEHDLKVGRYITEHAERVLEAMGAENVRSSVSGSPPTNLVAGGCRFGNRPETSVLDANCRVHDVDNLYVTDGSFMPTGGSVPFTWTIYANSFRVADKIIADLGGRGSGMAHGRN